MEPSPEDNTQYISKIFLDEAENIRLSPQVHHERRIALLHLLDGNHFEPLGGFTGPYTLHLSVEHGHLVFAVDDENDTRLTSFRLPIATFHSIIKDYFTICDSYLKAIKTLPLSRIEAIDMGRRGIHDEGAELLRDVLSKKARMDKDTARRLFTLVCVLHIRV